MKNKKKTNKKKRKNIIEKLGNSPINYFSDLFIVFMVLLWVFGIILISLVALYTTFVYQDMSLWQHVTELIIAPVTAGGALWMIKNGVQHALANRKGKVCDFDFPKVNPPDDDTERETLDFQKSDDEYLNHE